MVANPLFVLVASSVIIIAFERLGKLRANLIMLFPLLAAVDTTTSEGVQASIAVKRSIVALFLTFLKIGAILYGSAYVQQAFLRTDFIQNYHVLTSQ
jgi:chromate transporter